jgi:hypothetical protein
MKIDFEGQVREFSPDAVTVKQGIAIWLAHGMTLEDWENGMQHGDARAMQSAYWLMLQQNGVTKPIADCDFAVGPFSVALLAAQEAEEAETPPEPEPVPTQPGATAASPEPSSQTTTTPPLGEPEEAVPGTA